MMVDVCSHCQAVFSLKDSDQTILAKKLSRFTQSFSSNTNSGDSIHSKISQRVEDTEEYPPRDQPASKRARLSASPPSSGLQGIPTTPIQCMLCLGLNSESYIEVLVNEIIKSLAAENYQGISSFVLAIHAPLSLKVRRMGMEHFLMSIKQSGTLTKDTDKTDQDAAETAVLKKISGECQPNSKPGDPPFLTKYISDEYFVKTNVRLRTKYLIEKKLSHLSYNVDSPFLITVKLDHVTSDQDCMHVLQSASKLLPKLKKSSKYKTTAVTTNTVNNSIDALTLENYVDNGFFLTAVHQPCSYKIEFTHKPVFIGGRYNKYSRTLPQTPWIVDGVRKAESSVEELICGKLTYLIISDGYNFSSSGREDVDVRMLGNGRPFLVELLNPRNHLFTNEDIDSVERDINSSTMEIQVQKLKTVSKEATNVLKKGEEEKVKSYSSLIWTPQKITADSIKFLDELTELELNQKTPIRVLHRRTLATRKRIVYDLKAMYVDNHHFTLLLSTQAGTYVKEFVHGDFGRTQPNLRALMRQDVDILSLDVLDVKLDWPV